MQNNESLPWANQSPSDDSVASCDPSVEDAVCPTRPAGVGGVRRLMRDERGLSTVEYALLLCLVVIAGFTAWQSFGGNLTNRVSEAGDAVGGITGTPGATPSNDE